MEERDTARFNLHGGQRVDVPRHLLTGVYDQLWLFAERRGAISAAAKVLAIRPALRPIADLDERESDVFLQAWEWVARSEERRPENPER